LLIIMTLLIKNVLLGRGKTSILIEGNRIASLGGKDKTGHVLDGSGKAALPGLVNCHTHAAMSLMRGYADDLPLQEWLEGRIWPLEARLTEEDVYWGSRLACLEMIKTGTTCFNDMYWHWRGTARAVQDSGLRAYLSEVFVDLRDKDKADEQIKVNKRLYRESRGFPERVGFALGPHAPYSVSRESLAWVRDFSEEHNIPVHFHLSETEREVRDCLDKHGRRPVEYLEEIGFLSSRLIACHSVWLSPGEIGLLKKHDVRLVYNPASNMKLGSGTFPYPEVRRSGLLVALGTDGCASNNNLDMLEEMKFASLLQKLRSGPAALPVGEALEMATLNGARALGLDAGEIKPGKLADIILVDLKRPELTPGHGLPSNLVYSAQGSCIDTVICDGKILMENRTVPGEEDILEKASEVAKDLVQR
jgi:5-methylthioadenosine/S-adenosylhomocysteine deaminase